MISTDRSHGFLWHLKLAEPELKLVSLMHSSIFFSLCIRQLRMSLKELLLQTANLQRHKWLSQTVVQTILKCSSWHREKQTFKTEQSQFTRWLLCLCYLQATLVKWDKHGRLIYYHLAASVFHWSHYDDHNIIVNSSSPYPYGCWYLTRVPRCDTGATMSVFQWGSWKWNKNMFLTNIY